MKYWVVAKVGFAVEVEDGELLDEHIMNLIHTTGLEVVSVELTEPIEEEL